MAMTRQLSVTYGAVTVGGASADYHLDGPVLFDQEYGVGSVAFTVHVFNVAGYTEVGFSSACQTLEDEFRKPRQKLEVKLGDATRVSWDPADATNTGFNARPSIEVDPVRTQTGRSAIYRCRVEVDLPADLAGQSGLRGAKVRVVQNPAGRYEIELRGTYTALTTKLARAQAIAAYSARMDVVKALVDDSATWDETVLEVAEHDDTNKLCSIVAHTRELVLGESDASTNDADLRRQELSVRRERAFRGGSRASVRPLQRVAVYYSVFVEKTKDLKAKWESTCLSWIATRVKAATGASSVALVQSSPDFDYVNGRITATTAWDVLWANSLLAYHETIELVQDDGQIIVPVWNGDPFGVDLQPGPIVKLRVTTKQSLEYGGKAAGTGQVPGAGPGDVIKAMAQINVGSLGIFGLGASLSILVDPPAEDDVDPRVQGEWLRLGRRTNERDVWRGIPPYQFRLVERHETVIERFVNPVQRGNIGGGATPAPGQGRVPTQAVQRKGSA